MFAGYKTYITAGLAVLGAVAAYLTGEATAFEAAQLAATAVLAAFLRMGVHSEVTR